MVYLLYGLSSNVICFKICISLISELVGKQSGSSSKGETELPYDPAIPLLGIYPKELNRKNLYTNVHSVIHNSQKVETTKVSIS